MKSKKLTKIIIAVLCIAVAIVFSGCVQTPSDNIGQNNIGQEDSGQKTEDINSLEKNEEGIIKPEQAKFIIEATAQKVIKAVKDKDFKSLSEYAHPEKGVRFTPYTNVSVEGDVVFKPEELENFFQDEKVYLWGYYDGSGEEINLTPAEYYESFIYTADFANPKEIGYNEVLSFGNMLENQFEVYADAIVVEYYFPGFDPQYEGMDWQSLRLVFQHHAGDWKLVGIIHNQWTI